MPSKGFPVSSKKGLKIAQERFRGKHICERRLHLGDFIEDKAILNPADAVVAANYASNEEVCHRTPREEKVSRCVRYW